MNGGLRSTPLLYPTAAFAVGIVLSVEFVSTGWAIAAGLTVISLVLLAVGRRYAGVLAIISALGCAAMTLDTPEKPDFSLLTPTTEITATVTDARESDSGSRLVVETLSTPPFKAIVYIRSGEALFRRDDTIRFNGVWRSPDAPVDVPCEFSMAPYCFRRGITAICNADKFSILAEGNYQPTPLERLRLALADAIRYSGVNSSTADLLEGILLGNAEAIDTEMRELYSEAGLAHMLALSGTHLTVITAFLALVFFPLRLGGKRQWAWVATLAAMWGYVVLTGAPASVVRAAVMASFVIVGRVLGQPTSSLNSLCAAALAILLFSPKDLYSPGFQMSFLAVAGILMFAFKLTELPLRNPLLRILNSWIAVCVAAVVGTAGVSSWLFHRFPVAFLVSNIPATLLLPLFMGGGILLVLLSLAGLKAAWLAVTLDWLAEALGGIAEMVNNLWWHQIEGLWYPAWILIFYYGALLLLYIALEQKKVATGISAAIMMTTFFCLSFICAPNPPRRELFRVQDSFCSAWVVFDDGKAYIFSDAPERHREALRSRVAWRLREPLAIRGIDSLQIAPATVNSSYFRKEGSKVAVGQTDIVFIDRPKDVARFARPPKYAVVGGHYRHNIKAVVDLVNPDTIILSPSLDFAIEQKFAHQLDSMGVDYIKSEYRYWK